jgi:hypothetical protein
MKTIIFDSISCKFVTNTLFNELIVLQRMIYTNSLINYRITDILL